MTWEESEICRFHFQKCLKVAQQGDSLEALLASSCFHGHLVFLLNDSKRERGKKEREDVCVCVFEAFYCLAHSVSGPLLLFLVWPGKKMFFF